MCGLKDAERHKRPFRAAKVPIQPLVAQNKCLLLQVAPKTINAVYVYMANMNNKKEHFLLLHFSYKVGSAYFCKKIFSLLFVFVSIFGVFFNYSSASTLKIKIQ